MSYLVFDIGGTNTRLAFFKKGSHRGSKGGGFIYRDSFKTVNGEKLLDELVFRVRSVMVEYGVRKFEGIGISAPGFLESDKLKLTAPVNLKNVRNLKLGGLKKYCKKIVLENDANCAALGAFVLEKRKIKNLVCFTLGTGFGSGLVLDGKLYSGEGVASEFGHTTIDINGKKCNCGNVGCLENYVSTKGLLELIRGGGLSCDIFGLRDLAGRGDRSALKVYKKFGEYLSVGLVNVANTLDPEMIYISGGLSKSSKFFLKSAVEKARCGFFRGVKPNVKVNSENLSVIGALELVRFKSLR